MFYPGGIYRHISTLDIDLLIVHVQYSGDVVTKMRTRVLNRNMQKGEFIILPSLAVEIPSTDNWKWKLVGWDTSKGRVNL